MDKERLRETLRRAVMLQDAGIAGSPNVVKQLAAQIAEDMRILLAEDEEESEIGIANPVQYAEQRLRDQRALALLCG